MGVYHCVVMPCGNSPVRVRAVPVLASLCTCPNVSALERSVGPGLASPRWISWVGGCVFLCPWPSTVSHTPQLACMCASSCPGLPGGGVPNLVLCQRPHPGRQVRPGGTRGRGG